MAEQLLEDDKLQVHGLRAARALVPLKALQPAYRDYLFANAEVQAYYPGQRLFEAGAYEQRHLYLLHGLVELDYGDGRRERVNGGTMEFPLAHEFPRSCSAVAVGDCSVLSVDSAQLDRILSWNQIAEYLMADIAAERNYDEDNVWMQTVLSSNLFFKVPPVNVETIFERLTPMVVLADEVIIRQGEIGDCCYFIKEGTASVTRYSDTAEKDGKSGAQKVADIGVGRCFGEDALIYQAPRNASVTMTSDGVLMRLEKKDFLVLLKEPDIREVSLEDVETESPVLIDVRTEEEYGAGHLEHSANFPLNLVSLKRRLLSSDRQYLFYCDTGRRSRYAAYLLAREGYTTAALQGGLRGAGLIHQLRRNPDYILRDGELLACR